MMAELLGVPKNIAEKALEKFYGAGKRLELKKIKFQDSNLNFMLYEDYAHHPVEIKASLQAMREMYPSQKILTVFQPHQYSRTRAFLDEFSFAFLQTDAVIIPNIYEARDSKQDIDGLNTQALVDAIHCDISINGIDFENTANIIKNQFKDYDIVVIMGAGDVHKISSML